MDQEPKPRVELPDDFRPEVLSDWAAKIADPGARSFAHARIADFHELAQH